MISVNFIIGYLGAGKTTFIQSYLNSRIGQTEKVILIVNDFGKVNYDAQALNKNDVKIKSITYGCLCCDLQIRFRELLLECGNRKDLDRILIEPSGILIPDIITEIFQDSSISANLTLEPLIQLIDVNLFFKIRNKVIPPFIERQIVMSEKIVLNRVETISKSELMEVKNVLHQLNPRATYYQFSKRQNADKIVLNSTAKIEVSNISNESEILSSHKYRNIQIDKGLDFKSQQELEKYFKSQGPNLERAKGIITIKQIPFMVNYTKTETSLVSWTKSMKYGISMIFSNPNN